MGREKRKRERIAERKRNPESKCRAVWRYARVSPRKMMKIVRPLRGMSYSQAMDYLTFLPVGNAAYAKKVLRSAGANAEENAGLMADELVVASAHVDQGPTIKRIRRGSMGRSGSIRKRTCHITIELARA